MSNGKRANASGQNLMGFVASNLDFYFEGKPYIQYEKEYTLKPNELIVRPIDSGTIRFDFMIRGLPVYEGGLAVSCKRQETSGSVDQKLYYHIKHEVKECSRYPVVLILVGKAWKESWREFARQEIDNQRLIAVFDNPFAFIEWIKELPGFEQGHGIIERAWNDMPLFKGDAYNADAPKFTST